MAQAPSILVLNGPNLNLLGSREPDIYGRESLAEIEEACRRHGRRLGLSVDFRQSNHEGELVTWIQEARGRQAGLVVNAAGFTTSSVALLDALLASGLPVIEVHLSNIFRREAFRQHSLVSLAAKGVICGLGSTGYLLALEAFARLLETVKEA